MEDIEKTTTSNIPSFVEHMTSFDNEFIYNILQYSILSIIPIVVLNKVNQSYIPEYNEYKPTMEISLEVIFQVAFLFIGMFFIHKLISFVPTFSGKKYPSVNIFHMILPFLVIVLSLQTKLGMKVQCLTDRFADYIFGDNIGEQQNKKHPNVNISQPIMKEPVNVRPPYPQQQSQQVEAMTTQHQSQQEQHQMQQEQRHPQQPPQSQPVPDMTEPMAANDIGGFTPF